MILEPKHKNFAGETVKKNLISGAICQHHGLFNATTLR
jgi:hypothetical protein